jgi:hypothetical protein
MPTPTYTPLATVTLGSSASSVTFSNIPATYRDLILVPRWIGTGGVALRIRPNSDSGNATSVNMRGNGSTTGSGTGTTIEFAYADGGGDYVGTVQFMDYSATDKHKTVLTRSSNGDLSGTNYVWAFAARWASTSAMTSLVLIQSSGNIAAGSTFNLYGVIA